MKLRTYEALCEIKVNYIKGNGNVIETIQRKIKWQYNIAKYSALIAIRKLASDTQYMNYKLENLGFNGIVLESKALYINEIK